MTQPRFKGKYRVESTRLQNWNYAANGWYFVTICTRYRTHFFGEVITSQMQFSTIGEIAQQFWAEIPKHWISLGKIDSTSASFVQMVL